MFNMSNIVITSLHELISNFSKNGIAMVPNENVLALTQKMDTVCERLYESKELPRETP